MADDLCFLPKAFEFQDNLILKSPKKNPLISRMVVLIFSMVYGIYIISICLRQIGGRSNGRMLSVQALDKPCEELNSEPSEKTFVHFPKPKTFDRGECACNPVRKFVIVSTQRAGSGWFETLLNSHTNVSSNGEILGTKIRRSNISTIVETLDEIYNLDWLSSASKNECTAAIGFKWMLNQGLMQHHEEVVEYFKARGVSILFLFRKNLLRRMISLLANSHDKKFRLVKGIHKSHVISRDEAKILARFKPTINTTLLIPDLQKVEGLVAKSLEYFKSTRHIILYYEDVVQNRTKLIDVQDFLRVPQHDLNSRQVKIHKGSLSSQVENWDEVRTTLNGTHYEGFLHEDYKL